MPGKRAPEDVRREQILRAAFEVATRKGIGGLTIRAVAEEAELSHALVLFHFQRKERLVRALLDWLIETTFVLHVPGDIARVPRAPDRLNALLRQEMARLARQPGHTRLFFEFCALGARHEWARARIDEVLARYRAAFRGIMEELLQAEPARGTGATADGLAAVAVSWIHGFAVLAMAGTGHVDPDEYLSAVRGIVGQPA